MLFFLNPVSYLSVSFKNHPLCLIKFPINLIVAGFLLIANEEKKVIGELVYLSLLIAVNTSVLLKTYFLTELTFRLLGTSH